jgi:hypothetical protein
VISTAAQPDAPIEYEVEMVERRATDEQPATLRVSVRNLTDSWLYFGEERAVQFQHVASDDGALYLLPDNVRIEEYADPGCWRLAEPVAVPEYYGTFGVDAGWASVAESYVLGSAELPEGECLPSGEHRVRTSGRVAPTSDGVLEGSSESTDYQWGFTLRVG